MADLRVNLAFTADTKQAQASIQQLQQSLQQISNAGIKGSMTKEMEQASAAAKELSFHLNQAFNVKTGKFDLSQLDRSLKSSGANIDVLSAKLLGAGQQGQQAFIKLAQTVAAAERPTITLSKRLTGLFTTLKNTAKWQISSTVLHGFMSAVQQAYGYAQDLNKSLNNISIVTGYNTEQMAKFAEEANRSAKALSTTTTAYTDASLIYYQQGLDDETVKKRTDVTIKLANVSRQSAEEVSSQMTAIWNNFDDGTKSLEYYADAITALGAKTASSSAEIAEGLQKFAAVSDTVGLSYEYATAALATVVAQTRQSADTVGTAFKTLFARIEGLKLGETLEDGTTFNQYSEALAKIGVNIKDTNGELRNMDDILDDMGVKWKDLSRDEQVAVAQKVAGVRQYQQMIALMDNYDIFKSNVNVASDSTGTLQKQADIYAQSWEAASKRVKASAESIYSDLLDDQFFIKLTNGLSSLLNSLDAFIDGMGGIGPLIMGVGSMLLGVFANKVPTALHNLRANFDIVFKGAAKSAEELSTKMQNTVNSAISNPSMGWSQSQQQDLQNAQNLITVKNRLSDVSGKLTEKEAQEANVQKDLIEAQQKELSSIASLIDEKRTYINQLEVEGDEQQAMTPVYEQQVQAVDKLRQKLAEADQAYMSNMREDNGSAMRHLADDLAVAEANLEKYNASLNNYKEVILNSFSSTVQFNAQTRGMGSELDSLQGKTLNVSNQFVSYRDSLSTLLQTDVNAKHAFGDMKQAVGELMQEFEAMTGGTLPKASKAFRDAFNTASGGSNNGAEKLKENIVLIIKELERATIPANKLREAMERLGMGKYADKVIASYKSLGQQQDKLNQKQTLLNSLMDKFHPTHIVSGVEALTKTAAGLGSTAMVINSVRSAFDALNNQDLSFGEKVTTILMSISMGFGAVMSALRSFSGVMEFFQGLSSAILALNGSQEVLNNTTLMGTLIEQGKIAISEEGLAISQAKTLAYIQEGMAERGMTDAVAAGILIKKLDLTEDQASTVIKSLRAGKTIEATLAEIGFNTTVAAGTVIKAADTVATWMMNAALAALGITLSPITALIIAFVAALAGIALVITGVVVGLKAISEAHISHAEAVKTSAERVQNFEERLGKARTEAENLKSTISNWDSAISALDELDKNTEEYAQKLKEANDQAKDLIETYGLYSNYKIQNGVITIDQEALDRVTQEKNAAVRQLENDTYAEKIGQLDLNKKDIVKDTNKDLKDLGLIGKLSGNELDEIVAAMDKAQTSTSVNSKTGEVTENQILLDPDVLARYLGSSLSGLSEDSRYAIQALGTDLIDEVVQYKNTTSKQQSQADYYEDQIRTNLIQDKYGTQLNNLAQGDANKSNTLLSLFNQMQEKFDILNGYDLEENIADAKRLASKETYSNKDLGVKNDKDLALTYAKEYLGTLSEKDEKKAEYEGGSGKGGLKVDDTTIIASDTSDQAMRRDIMSKRAGEATMEDYKNEQLSDDILASLERISGAGREYGAKIGADLNQALLESFESNEQKINLSSIFSELDQSEIDDLLKLSESPDDLIKKLGINPDDLALLGYDNAKQFAEAFSNGLSSWDPEAAAAQFKEKLAAATAADAEEFGLDPDMLQEVAEGFLEAADAGDEMYAALKGNAEKASDVARDYIRMNNAVLDLSDNYDDYAKVLKDVQGAQKDADKAMIANTKTGKAFKKSLSDLIGTSEKMINTKFLDAIDPADFDAAAKGDAEAIGRIRDAFIDCNAPIKATKDEIDAFKQKLADADEGAELDLNNDPFIEKLIQAELAAGSSAEDIRDKLSGMGIQCDLTEFVGTMEEAKAFAKQTGGVVADSLSMESEINPGVDIEQGEITEQAFTENYSAGTPIPVESETPEMQPDGTMQLVPLHGYFTPGVKTVSTEPVKADTQGVVAAPSVNVKTGDGQEGKVGKHTIINNPTKKTNNVSSSTKDTANNNRNSCFIAGTLVSLGSDFKNIEDIEIGDIVLSYNEKTQKNEYSEVLQTMIHNVNEEIYDLYIEDEILSVTGIHKFLIKQNNFIQWMSAEYLQINDQVLFADGTWHYITDIKTTIQLITVYNFEVANNHNYYVGHNQILAHNKGGGCFEAGTLIMKDNGFENIENIKIGDIVLSYNQQTKKNEYSKVLQTMIHNVNEEIYTLYIEDDILQVTGIHKFLITYNKFTSWLMASNLQVGDQVLFADGTLHTITKIVINKKLTVVYNFEVAGNHNYYVGKNQILAHNKGGSKSGGDKTPAEKVKYTKKNEVVTRYKQTEDKLKVVNRNLEKYNKLADTAFGANKVKAMDKVIKQYDRQIDLQQELIDQATKYSKVDKKALDAAAKDLNVTLKYDEDGNVSNIEAAQEKIWKKLHELEAKKDSLATKEEQDEYDKNTLTPYKDKMSEFDSAYGLYEETIDKIAEAIQEKLNLELEKISLIMDKHLSKIRGNINLRLHEIEKFNKELERLGDTAFQTANKILLLNAQFKATKRATTAAQTGAKTALKDGIYRTLSNGKTQTYGEYLKAKGDKWGKDKAEAEGKANGLSDAEIKKLAKQYSQQYQDTKLEKVLTNNVSDDFWDTWTPTEDAINALEEFQGTIETLIDNLYEMQNVINSELPNAFAKWQDQVSKHTAQMDRLISRYQTWMDIVDTLGGHKLGLDTQAMKNIDEGNINMAIYDLKQAVSNKNTAQSMASKARDTFEQYKTDKKGNFVLDEKGNKILIGGQKYEIQKEAEQARRDIVNEQKRQNKKDLASTTIGAAQAARDKKQDWKANKSEEEYKAFQKTQEYKNNQAILDEYKKYNTTFSTKKMQTQIDESKQKRIENRQQINDLKAQLEVEQKKSKKKQDQERIKDLKDEIKKLSEVNAKARKQEELWEQQLKEYNDTVENNEKNLKSAREEGQLVKDEMLAGIDEIKDSVEEMEAEAEEAENNVLEKFLAVIQAAKQYAENAFEYERRDFEKSIAGGYDSIADMQTAMDQNKKRSERYLADYEKVYELTKLNRDLEKKMDETTNLKAKEKLAAFQQKIVDAQEKGLKMSKYDLEYMQKQYDLEVAKIALEEAQNAKTQVRLTRDAEGNYSYTYTADESKTAEAQQNYEDRLQEIIKLSNDYQEQMLESELKAKEEMLNSLQELHQAYLDGAYTKEEYDKKKAELEAWYTEELMYYADQRDQASRNNTEILMSEYDKYYGTTENKIKIERRFTDEQIANYETLKNTYDEASQNLRTNMIKAQEDYESGKITTENYIKELQGVQATYTQEVSDASDKMKTTMEGLKGATDGIITDSNEFFLPQYSDVWKSASDMNDDFLDKFYYNNDSFVNKFGEADDKMEKKIKDAFEAMGYTIEEGETVWQALGRVVAEETASAKSNTEGLQGQAKELTKTVKAENKEQLKEFEKSADAVAKWYKKNYSNIVAQQKELKKLSDKIDAVTAAAQKLNQTEIKPKVNTSDATKKIKSLKKELDALNSGGAKGNPGDEKGPTTPTTDTPTTQTGLSNKEKLEIAKKVAASIWLLGDWKNEEGGGHDRKWKLTQVFGSSGQNYIQSKINSWTKSGEINQIASDYSKYASSFTWAKMKKYIDSDQYKFATGGYTGRWGSDGRWALLHEKELVLNKQDTENMLAAIKTVREIAAMVDLQAQNASLASQYALAVGSVQGINNSGIDQNVHITAEFPNVQDHNEVELALTSLVNRASQFAWRQ